jgi:hypothetical protein
MSRERRRKKTRIRSSALLALLLLVIFVAAFLYIAWSPHATSNYNSPLGMDAAIVDQLTAFSPNKAFVEEAQGMLTSAGFTVKYYPPADVTVELYRHLPSLGYRLIILRVHTAGPESNGDVYPFTSEAYDVNRYPLEQLAGSLAKASMQNQSGPYYFAISPLFVSKEMQGNFRGAIIILSSCVGLSSTNLADALIRRGASALIGWDGTVTLTHTDGATLVLLKHLTGGSAIAEAVQAAMREVGPDPEYGSVLTYYPSNASQVTVWTLVLAAINRSSQVSAWRFRHVIVLGSETLVAG